MIRSVIAFVNVRNASMPSMARASVVVTTSTYMQNNLQQRSSFFSTFMGKQHCNIGTIG